VVRSNTTSLPLDEPKWNCNEGNNYYEYSVYCIDLFCNFKKLYPIPLQFMCSKRHGQDNMHSGCIVALGRLLSEQGGSISIELPGTNEY
jgi:hypothetical protein